MKKLSDKEIVVRQTTDYDMFKFLKGNRPVNLVHVERLKISFADGYLLSPVIINEKGEIIDGQHRFTAAKELELPIFFIIVAGFGLKEVQIYNMHSTNWTKKDFLNMYCDTGYPEYIKFRQFMEDYPEFRFRACEWIISNRGRTTEKIAGKHREKKYFEEGNLVIEDPEGSRKTADEIRRVKPFYANYNRETFVMAMIHILKVNGYDHDKFLDKLELKSSLLVDCSRVTEYREIIEKIYNFNNHNKLNLRF